MEQTTRDGASLLRRLRGDVHFYHQLRRPSRKVTGISMLLTIVRNPGLWLLMLHRVAHFSVSHRNLRNPLWWIARLIESAGKYFSAVCCKSEILEDCNFEGPLYLSNRGYIICGALRIGAGTLIHDHITIGHTVAHGKAERPTIGRNVWIGPNTIIAGPLTIGDGATILPGSYLTNSVPPRAVVRGNPARVVRGNFDNAALRTSLEIVQEIAAPKDAGPSP